jgi:redox-sensitive bicupin YhaK (pirin superfamily)
MHDVCRRVAQVEARAARSSGRIGHEGAGMSWLSAEEPAIRPTSCKQVEAVIVPRVRDLGGFEVRRVLPAGRQPAVGPFVFFDQMGPAQLAPGQGLDVRPHPHIGLATVTYLFEGRFVHRDSLGFAQPIRPGDVNWMTAGSGIVHSERSDPEDRKRAQPLSGIQAWVALPERDEEIEPRFVHHPAPTLPRIETEGTRLRLIAGTLLGQRSPVAVRSDLFYAELRLAAGASLSVPAEHAERGVYPLEGSVEIAGEVFEPGRLLVLVAGRGVAIRALSPAHLMLLGGEPLGRRHLWWNFVSSRPERIEQAKRDWKQGRFGAVPGDPEFIPLPE